MSFTDETPELQKDFRSRATQLIAIFIGAFMFYTSAFGSFESLIQRSSFLTMVALMGILQYPLLKNTSLAWLGRIVDSCMALVVISSTYYIITNYTIIMTESPFAENIDVFLCYATVLVLLELSRRAVSWLFPILVIAGIAYAMLGHNLEGSFGHRGFSYDYVAEIIFLSDKGLYGMLTGVASTVLAVFILFGAVLLHTGAGKTFFDLAARSGGSSPGGAAKIATIASGFFGMISGSSVANVATTGNFTIPLMKRLKYPAPFAAGVEAIASTGGQIAPPIMGTAAFVMAEFVGINYWLIAVSAIIPAALFYLGVFLTIHIIAKRQDLGRVDESELPDWRDAVSFKRLTPIVASFAGFGFGILQGYSVPLTAICGLLCLLVSYVFFAVLDRTPIKKIIETIIYALEEGGKGLVIVGILLIVAQVFVSMMNLTGLGVALTNAILNLGGNNVGLIMCIMAVVCLIAGMGLPTSAAYVLVAAVFAPSLIQLGIEPLTVHFFVLYYATLSVITPPVCVGVFVAAAIADTGWGKTSSYAVRLGVTAYVLPLTFVLLPGMLWQGSPMDIGLAFASGMVFTIATAYMFGGQPVFKSKLTIGLWIIPLVLGIMPNWYASAIGAVILVAMIMAANKLNQQELGHV